MATVDLMTRRHARTTRGTCNIRTNNMHALFHELLRRPEIKITHGLTRQVYGQIEFDAVDPNEVHAGIHPTHRMTGATSGLRQNAVLALQVLGCRPRPLYWGRPPQRTLHIVDTLLNRCYYRLSFLCCLMATALASPGARSRTSPTRA
jgi:hypothetical protein